MVNTNYSIASTLSGIYNTNSSALADSLAKLASGKRIVNASDDFGGYIKASAIQSQVDQYTIAKQDIQGAKSMMDYAKTVGNSIVTNLSRMDQLVSNYTAANGDTTQQASYSSEFDALVTATQALMDNSYYGGTKVYQAATLASANINPESTNTMDAITTNAADLTGAAITTGVTTALDDARTYLAQVTSFAKGFEQANLMADSAIASKKAAISAITDINEVVEMSNMTNLQVRNQAAVSMMSQANMSQQGLARLFM